MSEPMPFRHASLLRGMQADKGRDIDGWFHARRALRSLTRPIRRRADLAGAGSQARRSRRLIRRWSAVSDAELAEVVADLRANTGDAARRRAALLAAAALISSRRIGLTPHPAQLVAAHLLLAGRLVELETGAGKTLAAGLAATVAALEGRQVHLVTANDYLAGRDRETLAPIYEAFGLTHGLIAASVGQAERVEVYARDVLHASNKELAFDYLRNRITLGGESGPVRLALEPLHTESATVARLTMTGLPFAIVDEADSVLVDECRTPLIISAEAPPDPGWADAALRLAAPLEEGRDYLVDAPARDVRLTDAGCAHLADLGEDEGGIWRNAARREDAARLALLARHHFRRDEHYVVRDGKIALIEEFTGRVAEGRSLGDGLHQIIERREDVAVTGRRYTRGRMTYQRFFRRYSRLAGLTATAREVADELEAVYDLPVVPVASRFRCRRRTRRLRICRDEAAKWARVARSIRREVRHGRPVLVATRTVLASHALSEALQREGIEHVVLNALNDADEAAIVAEAGQPGRVTVATNMAGRGVDIRLAPEVRTRGGLHVILTERHEAGRIDRQVLGRCARQGDPGSVETILAWTDPILEKFGQRLARRRTGGGETFRHAQVRAERAHARARMDLLKNDLAREKHLAFTGAME